MATECLRCVIGGTPVALPVHEVSKIAEYSVSPHLPMAEAWVSGVALLGDKVWLSLSFQGSGLSKAAAVIERARKGVLFKEGTGDLRWALEVDDVLGLGMIDSIEEKPFTVRGWTCPEHWIRRAVTKEGQALGWIDTAAIVARLRGAQAAEN